MFNNIYIKSVQSVVDSVYISSYTNYTIFGNHVKIKLPKKLKNTLKKDKLRNILVENLKDELYLKYYCTGTTNETISSSLEHEISKYHYDPFFVHQLSISNKSHGYFDENWKIDSINKDKMLVSGSMGKFYISFKNDNEKYISEYKRPKIGQDIKIHTSKEMFNISPGFYMVNGDKSIDKDAQILRFYWNIKPDGAIKLIHNITTILNKINLPFKLKIVNDPARFTRCDSAVLYVEKKNYFLILPTLQKIHNKIYFYMKDLTPSFTKKIAKGLAIAEDPGISTNESFGTNRCRILAEGLVKIFEANNLESSEQINIIINCFKENNINLEKPYLKNYTSTDFYKITKHKKSQKTQSSNLDYKTELKNTSLTIGKYFVRTAIWHNNVCNWLGYTTEKNISPLSCDLYNGTSGIAFFLTNLYLKTKDISLRKTALGAINQSLIYYHSYSQSQNLSLFNGLLGILLIAIYMGKKLKEKNLINYSIGLLNRYMTNSTKNIFNDIIYGKAGSIVSLLTLQNMFDDDVYELTIKLGNRLVMNAEKSFTGYSWKSPKEVKSRKNLTGFSHGTAGISYSLFELYNVIKKPQFLDAGNLALDYEQHYFDKKTNNWIDFRLIYSSNKEKHSFPIAWCHGAAGIAMSRTRSYYLLKNENYKKQALCGFETTLKNTILGINNVPDNFSLCHGLSGNLDALIYGQGKLNNIFISEELFSQISRIYSNNYNKNKLSSMFDYNYEFLGLMLGLAGIGDTCLRMSTLDDDNNHPSILLLEPEKFFNLS